MKRVSVLLALLLHAGAAAAAPGPGIVFDLGPITGAAGTRKVVTVDLGARVKTKVYDVQDGREHAVRGLSFAELLHEVGPSKSADAAVFVYKDGMQIPVRLRDPDEVGALFVAFEHGDDIEGFGATYPLQKKGPLPCPKVVYQRKITSYSIWLYPTELDSIRLVTWKTYEAQLAQPTRQLPDRSGWPLYLRHCSPCHGIGGQGAKRGPDFLSTMEAYRRVPPIAITDQSEPPSLHEKVKGFTEGAMPVLDHISNAEITTLWRWLHAIHRGATK